MKKRIDFRMNAKVISTLGFFSFVSVSRPLLCYGFQCAKYRSSPVDKAPPLSFDASVSCLACFIYYLCLLFFSFCNLNQYSSRIFWLEPTCSWYSPSDCITCFLVEPAWLFRLSSRLSAWQRTPEINLHSCAFNFLYSK